MAPLSSTNGAQSVRCHEAQDALRPKQHSQPASSSTRSRVPPQDFCRFKRILVDKCIECGFCEPNCLSCGLALSSRQRVVVRREISRLRRDGSDPARLERLLKACKKPGIVMCAGDGLCSTSCPMEIDVGDLTHVLREEAIPEGGVAMKIGVFCGDHLKSVKSGLRPILGLARFGRSILGAKGTTLAGKALHKIGLPLWTPALPGPKLSPSKRRTPNSFLFLRSRTRESRSVGGSAVTGRA